MAKSTEQKIRKGGGLFETAKTIIYAVLIALIIRSFAFEPFNIPSGSMIPNLLIGDYRVNRIRTLFFTASATLS